MSIWQALCSYNGQLFAAWKGEVGDDRLFYSQFNGAAWAAVGMLPGNSSVGPALAVLGGSLYAAWKGENGDERLFLSKGTGVAWAPASVIPGVASSVGPSLAALGNKLYAAWKGMDTDQALWYASFDGVNWSSQATIPAVASSVGPSLATFNGKLYAAWKGMNNDQALWYASFDGTHWSPQAPIPNVASDVGPSLAVFNGKLYAAWKGQTGDQALWYASFDGTTWSAQTVMPVFASSIGPALAEYDQHQRIPIKLHDPGKLFAMWKGASSDAGLWFGSFDGSNWSAQSTVPGNTGQDVPPNIGLRMQYQETNQWCWIAVATSINHFYNPASTATQCGIMTTVGQNINGFAKNTSACPSATAVASVPGLAAILASPYTTAAEYALDNVKLGIPVEYIKSGGVGDALNVYGNWNKPGLATMSLSQIAGEVAAGRPVCVDIAWNGGGQHCVAIAGELDDQLLICDPIFGETSIQYELFPAAYQGGASVVSYALTKAGS